MSLRRGDHIPDDELEAYVQQQLSASRVRVVEEHLLVCERCRGRLVETEQFIQAFRDAAKELGGTPLECEHSTDRGRVRLAVTRSDEGWVALLAVGDQVSGRRAFTTVAEANRYLLRRFWRMFPGHTCTEACVPPKEG